MDLEIDFIAIGDETQSGDAIVFKYGNLQGARSEYKVVVIDAGFESGGEKVVKQIKEVYKTDTIDLLISTHPDNDHSGGIIKVLEEIKVEKMWMHKPWSHTDNIAKLFNHSAVTDKSVKNRIEKGLAVAKDIEEKANELSITIEEPFAGLISDDKKILVLGPDKDYYEKELLPNFRCTPEPKSLLSEISSGVSKISEAIKSFFDERWDIETLDDSGTTTAENNSSAIIMLLLSDDYHVLFTADAGQPAMTKITDLLDSISYDYSKIRLVQVPHHGSHRNINPGLLDKIIGPRLDRETQIKMAIVSVSAKDDGKHPSKRVINAFIRRGSPVHQTRGISIYHGIGNAPRANSYPASTPITFFNGRIEEGDE